jgi:serine/threonine-protein kinase
MASADPKSVALQLEKILASEGFVRADRLSRLLKFTVEQALAGNADTLKEFTLGVEVFDKDSAFDPRVDTVVRVQARRLRQALTEYYAGPGKVDPVIIEYPKGSYAPVFSTRESEAPAPPPPKDRRWLIAGFGASALIGAGYIILKPPATSAHRLSLAVLPFRLLNPTKEFEYLGVGMADALITRLTNQRQIYIRPTSSVLSQADADPRKAGEALKVDFILEGSLRTAGTRVRLSVQLIKISEGAPVWGSAFDEDVSDIFRVEDSLSRQVADALSIQFNGKERARVNRKLSNDAEAHRLYLQGRYAITRYTGESARTALDLLRAAVQRDPNLTHAWASIAEVILNFSNYDWDTSLLPEARRAAERAVALDSELAEGHVSLGHVKWYYDWDWAGAESEFKTAIALQPDFAPAHDWYGQFLAQMGRLEDARRELTRSIELDPASIVTRVNLNMVDYYAGDFRKSAQAQEQLLAADATFFPALIECGRSYDLAGEHDKAIEYLERARAVSPSMWVRLLIARATARKGDKGAARKRLEEVERSKSYSSPAMRAMVYDALGDHAQATALLEEAVKERSPWITFFKQDPVFRAFRKVPPVP